MISKKILTLLTVAQVTFLGCSVSYLGGGANTGQDGNNNNPNGTLASVSSFCELADNDFACTDGSIRLAIVGDAMANFVVQDLSSMELSCTTERDFIFDGEHLTTLSGLALLSIDGNPITLPLDTTAVRVNYSGEVLVTSSSDANFTKVGEVYTARCQYQDSLDDPGVQTISILTSIYSNILFCDQPLNLYPSDAGITNRINIGVEGNGFIPLEGGKYTTSDRFYIGANGVIKESGSGLAITTDGVSLLTLPEGAVPDSLLIDSSGVCSALVNGDRVEFANLRITVFTNPAGLNRNTEINGSIYSASANSGAPRLLTPGQVGAGTVTGTPVFNHENLQNYVEDSYGVLARVKLSLPSQDYWFPLRANLRVVGLGVANYSYTKEPWFVFRKIDGVLSTLSGLVPLKGEDSFIKLPTGNVDFATLEISTRGMMSIVVDGNRQEMGRVIAVTSSNQDGFVQSTGDPSIYTWDPGAEGTITSTHLGIGLQEKLVSDPSSTCVEPEAVSNTRLASIQIQNNNDIGEACTYVVKEYNDILQQADQSLEQSSQNLGEANMSGATRASIAAAGRRINTTINAGKRINTALDDPANLFDPLVQHYNIDMGTCGCASGESGCTFSVILQPENTAVTMYVDSILAVPGIPVGDFTYVSDSATPIKIKVIAPNGNVATYYLALPQVQEILNLFQ